MTQGYVALSRGSCSAQAVIWHQGQSPALSGKAFLRTMCCDMKNMVGALSGASLLHVSSAVLAGNTSR